MPPKRELKTSAGMMRKTTKATPDEDGVSEASSSESETGSASDEVDSEEQEKNTALGFSLTCLKNWNSERVSKCFNDYLERQKDKTQHASIKIRVPKITQVEDFTPWWDNFATPSRKSLTKVGAPFKQDSDSFQNWFLKTTHGSNESSTSSWLSGPTAPTVQDTTAPQQDAPVEDIEVPSIYEQTPRIKGRRALKKERKAEREKTLGKKWFDMRAPEVDDATRMDMEMIRMRGALDPKRFYKHNDRRAMPKYFQMGTVVDEGTDFYSSRLTKKQRKQTLVEELMADANVRQYNKRKYSEVQQKMRTKKKLKGNKS